MSSALNMSRADCEQQLKKRIEKGKQLISKVENEKNFNEAFDIFISELTNWRSFNVVLLKRLFVDETISKEFDAVSSGDFLPLTQDDYDQYRGYKSELNSEINFLEGCIERLALYNEPTNPDQSFQAGQTFDAFTAIVEVLQKAKTKIQIIDAYIDHKTLSMIATKQSSVATVQILTKSQCITQTFSTAKTNYETQHGAVEIKKNETFHDRFIIIDDSEVWQSGASLKDAGKQTCTLVQLKDTIVANAIIAVFATAWQASSSI